MDIRLFLLEPKLKKMIFKKIVNVWSEAYSEGGPWELSPPPGSMKSMISRFLLAPTGADPPSGQIPECAPV